MHLKEMAILISGENMGFSSEQKKITGQINEFPESLCEFDTSKKKVHTVQFSLVKRNNNSDNAPLAYR